MEELFSVFCNKTFLYSLSPSPVLWKNYEYSFWFLLIIEYLWTVLKYMQTYACFLLIWHYILFMYSLIQVLWSMERKQCSMQLSPICQRFSGGGGEGKHAQNEQNTPKLRSQKPCLESRKPLFCCAVNFIIQFRTAAAFLWSLPSSSLLSPVLSSFLQYLPPLLFSKLLL